jgi:hypothetical protein
MINAAGPRVTAPILSAIATVIASRVLGLAPKLAAIIADVAEETAAADSSSSHYEHRERAGTVPRFFVIEKPPNRFSAGYRTIRTLTPLEDRLTSLNLRLGVQTGRRFERNPHKLASGTHAGFPE